MCSPGTMISTRTPRRRASTSASTALASGTKYELAMCTERVAAAIESRYISRALALPSAGELLNTCARLVPAGARGGKYASSWGTSECVLSQLSMKAACIWATAGPSRR